MTQSKRAAETPMTEFKFRESPKQALYLICADHMKATVPIDGCLVCALTKTEKAVVRAAMENHLRMKYAEVQRKWLSGTERALWDACAKYGATLARQRKGRKS